MKFIALGIVILMAGCQTTSSVVSTGPDTYMLSTAACPACGGSAKALTLALQEASTHCAGLGKVMLRKSISKENLNYAGAGGSSIEFRCLDPDHPEYVRADGARESDIIIETR